MYIDIDIRCVFVCGLCALYISNFQDVDHHNDQAELLGTGNDDSISRS